ncbi:MAG TPA: 3-phosphoserine/phosphohydroxythreonine transaminase [Polyangiaceae bacterium]|nr:3-phosphoserine/phosphohydroxythreonine transaminase [Polyangiaceae bacterium]
MTRVHNFNPGPSALPLAALERAQREMLDFEGSGMSIMEHSHRGKVYDRVHQEALELVRKLAGVPDTHDILFLQGGATQQFAQVPMNLRADGQSADYVIGGVWGQKAFKEASHGGKARIAATTERPDGKFTRVSKNSEIELDANAAYVHITSNNTVMGTQVREYPDTGKVPLICDMSSDILALPIDVSRFGLIYAGAQKNMGPSGITVVIVAKSLIEAGRKDIPYVFQYRTQAAERSLANTCPTFAIYMLRNVLAWLDEQGGVAWAQEQNEKKAGLLYQVLEERSDVFSLPVDVDSRSIMNVVWNLATPELEAACVARATEAGLVGLKGHRIVGGLRASIYNAVPLASVERLAEFLRSYRP